MSPASEEPLAIELESPDFYNVTHEELQQLRETILSTDAFKNRQGTVSITARREYGAGSSFGEMIHVLIPSWESLRDDAYGVAMALVFESMRKRFGRAHEGRRPRFVIVRSKKGGAATYELSDARARARLHESEGFDSAQLNNWIGERIIGQVAAQEGGHDVEPPEPR